MRRAAITLLSIGLLLANDAHAARKLTVIEAGAFGGLGDRLREIRAGYPENDPLASQVFPLLDKSIEDLEYLTSLARDQKPPADYVNSLKQIQEFLIDNVHSPEITPQDAVNVQKAQRELEIKRECAEKRKERGRKPLDPIDMTVRTVTDAGVEVKGYRVICVGSLWAENPPKAYQLKFGRQSSPTARPISAGEYAFWAVKGGWKSDQKIVVTCENGSKTQNIDLTVK